MDIFTCSHCKKIVNEVATGTHHRNHCPYCLWSLHVDKSVSGDRKSNCKGLMEPVGLTFKKERIDKYGKKKQGEIMLVHQCQKCGEISINRIAGDDDPQKILNVLAKTSQFPVLSDSKLRRIDLLEEDARKEVERQLFGCS